MMFTPPSYCIDAIATDNGWVNPKNGELLVAIKNLSTRIREQEFPQETVEIEEITQEILNTVENVVDDVIINGPHNHVMVLNDDIDVEENIPAKKRPGRPKKQKES